MATSGGAGGGGAVHSAVISSTAGDLTFSTANASGFTLLGLLTGGTGASQFALQVAAAAGDQVLLGINCIMNLAAGSTFFDIQMTTSLNFVSSGTPTATTNGISAWAGLGSEPSIGPSLVYVVQAGDVFSGHVTFNPGLKTSSASSCTLFVDTNWPFKMYAFNLSALATGV